MWMEKSFMSGVEGVKIKTPRSEIQNVGFLNDVLFNSNLFYRVSIAIVRLIMVNASSSTLAAPLWIVIR